MVCTTLSCLAGAALITRIHITARPASLKLNTFQSDYNNKNTAVLLENRRMHLLLKPIKVIWMDMSEVKSHIIFELAHFVLYDICKRSRGENGHVWMKQLWQFFMRLTHV